MEYDVAISFAGEQRKEARQIAECLKKAGLRVFFDEYEDAQLWGKNLYDHLSHVYQKEAQYCIILVSHAYANKVWPNHERQSAQVRALQEKENVYILPIRFDDSELPGLLPTIAYLDFAKYGATGICNAFLRKTKQQTVGITVATKTALVASASRRVLVLNRNSDTIAYLPVVKASWSAQNVSFVLEPDDETDVPFLDGLQGITHDLIVAYAGKVALCNHLEITHVSDGSKDSWHLKAQIKESDFSSTLEVGTSGTSREQFAEMRTRRLLLNEHPPKDNQGINDTFHEIMVRGQGVVFEIIGSLFPVLFAAYGQNPTRFLEIAWIHAVMLLKLSNCVVDIERLRLELAGGSLRVSFKGKRRKEYQNAPAYQIEIDGACALEKQ
jgi:hypothetical protein